MLDSNSRQYVLPNVDRIPADIDGNVNSRWGRLLLGYSLYIYHFSLTVTTNKQCMYYLSHIEKQV